jgi:hypothetical protein
MGDAGGDTSLLPDTYVGPDTSMPPPDTGADVPTLPACPSPVFAPATTGTPPSATIMSGTNVSISAPGLPATGYIFYTTDNSFPNDNSPIYNAGTVGIQLTASTIFHAISSTKGATCTDSAPVEADYTVTPPPPPDGGGAPAIPTITPAAPNTTQNNDFQAQISDTSSGAVICYTLGATAPTCTVSTTGATCDMGTATYTAPIDINGATTQTAPGQVLVQAMACDAGGKSGVAMAQFTLQAATPTMSPMGTVPYSATVTGSFQDGTSGAAIYYTTDGSAPSCTAGGSVLAYSTPFALKSGSFKAVACKNGYQMSAVGGPFAVTVQLNAPVLSPAAGVFNVSPGPVSTTAASMAGEPAGTWYCYSASANGATNAGPACGAASGACSTGSATAPTPASGQQVQAIACAPAGYGNSTVATSGPYTLQLSPPFFNPDATNAAGASLTSYALTMADGTHPMSFAVQQPGGVTAGAWACVAENPAANAPPACDPATSGNVGCLAGTKETLTFTLAAGPGPTLAGLTAGSTISAIMCPDPSGATKTYSPSGVVSLIVSGTGQAPAPTIAEDNTANKAGTNLFYQPVNAAVLNSSTSPMTVCYTTDGTTPTCTPGSTAGGCSSLDGKGNLSLNYTVTTPGSGYTVPPFVTITPRAPDAIGACTGASATAAVANGAVTGITGAGTCANLTQQPQIQMFVGGGLSYATTGAAVSQSAVFTLTASGSGYPANGETVNLTETVGGNTISCNNVAATVTRGTGNGLASLTADISGCSLFPGTPTVKVNNVGGGTGAAATAVVTQTAVLGTAGAPDNGGQFYTTPPGVVLTPHAATPGGSCATYNTTIGAGGVVSAVTATGCAGFMDPSPSVTVTDPPAVAAQNGAGATAIGTNMFLVPTIAKNSTSLQAVSCNAGLSTSPVFGKTYTFALPTPLIGFIPTGGSFLSLGGSGVPITQDGVLTATTIGATGTGAVSATTAAFTDTTIVFSNDPLNTTPNCTGTGTAMPATKGSINLAIPLPDTIKRGVTLGTLNYVAVACSSQAAETNSPNAPAATGPFAIDTAVPVITTAVGSTSLSSLPSSTVTAQNKPTVSIASPTTGSYVCYTTDGTAPSCVTTGTGCHATGTVSKVATFPGTVNITTSGSVLNAVACATDQSAGQDTSDTQGNLVNTGTGGGIGYVLQISQSSFVANSYTAACPTVPSFGFDPANTNTAVTNTQAFAPQGGPTTGATVCYSLVSQPAGSCTAGAGVTCFAPSGAAPTQGASLLVNSNGTLFVTECSPGFQTSQFTTNFTLPAAPAANAPKVYAPPSIAVNAGTLVSNGWTTNELVTGNDGVLQGGFTYIPSSTPPTPYIVDALWFASAKYAASGTTDVVYYFSDGGASGTTAGIATLGAGTLPFKAQFAIDVNTNTGNFIAWEFDTTQATPVWSTTSPNAMNMTANDITINDLQTGAASSMEVELGIDVFNPTTFFGTGTNIVNAVALVVTNANGVGSAVNSYWPTNGANIGYVADGLQSCKVPTDNIQ